MNGVDDVVCDADLANLNLRSLARRNGCSTISAPQGSVSLVDDDELEQYPSELRQQAEPSTTVSQLDPAYQVVEDCGHLVD